MKDSAGSSPQGTYLGHAMNSACGNCGRAMLRAHRIHHGVSYCSNCYPSNFPPRTCEMCGKIARAHKNSASPVCRNCLIETRCCLRCGKRNPRIGLRVGEKVACESCARYYRTPQPCDACGAASTKLSRARAYPERGRMCEKCLRKAVGATCSHCHKHRGMFFMTLAREHVCRSCCENDHPVHACPDCGTSVGGPLLALCLPCSIKRSNQRRQVASNVVLGTEQAFKLHADFTRWCNESNRSSKLAANASRYLQFIVRINIALETGSLPLSQELLLQIFTSQEFRQMGLLAQFFAEQGLLHVNAAERRSRSDQILVLDKVQSCSHQSWGCDVQRFDASFATRAKPLNVRSRKAYLHAAISLLTFAKVERAHQLQQPALDGLLRRTPGLRASLTPFLSHLALHHGLALKLPAKTKVQPVSLVPQAREVRAILDALAGDISRSTRLALTASLLAKLLNAPLSQVLQLRHADVDWSRADQVRLQGKWLKLPTQLVPIISALQSPQYASGVDADPWVFPGRILVDTLSANAISYHLKKYAFF